MEPIQCSIMTLLMNCTLLTLSALVTLCCLAPPLDQLKEAVLQHSFPRVITRLATSETLYDAQIIDQVIH